MKLPSIKAIAIDDEKKGRETLISLIDEFCEGVEVVDAYSTVQEGVEGVKRHKPDLVFLDISLPEEDGFQFFKYFKKIDFDVVFVTAYASYRDQAVRYAVLDYLMKPLYIEDLKSIISKVQIKKKEQLKSKRDQLIRSTHLVLPTSMGLEFLEVQSILYCQSHQGHILIYKSGYADPIQVIRTMHEFHALIQNLQFLRWESELLVNSDQVIQIRNLNSPKVEFVDGQTLSVNPAFANIIKEHIL